MSDVDQIKGNYSRSTPPTFQYNMGLKVKMAEHAHHVQCVWHPHRGKENIVCIVWILLYVSPVFYSSVLIISIQ